MTFAEYIMKTYGITMESYERAFTDLSKEEIRHLYDTDVKK